RNLRVTDRQLNRLALAIIAVACATRDSILLIFDRRDAVAERTSHKVLISPRRVQAFDRGSRLELDRIHIAASRRRKRISYRNVRTNLEEHKNERHKRNQRSTRDNEIPKPNARR